MTYVLKVVYSTRQGVISLNYRNTHKFPKKRIIEKRFFFVSLCLFCRNFVLLAEIVPKCKQEQICYTSIGIGDDAP